MRVSIFGMGYVGCVSAACLAKAGHQVVGVDINPTKVKLINEGRSPIVEKDIDYLVQQAVGEGRLKCIRDVGTSIQESDLSLICVGTPSDESGGLDLTYVERATEEIAGALANILDYHVVGVRSTVLPGTLDSMVVPTLDPIARARAFS